MSNAEFQMSRNSAGVSNLVDLSSGWYSVLFTADAWGSATLEVGDGTYWMNALDQAGNAITVTANRAVLVSGGLSYRLNVASVNGSNAITARFYRAAD